MRIVPGTQTVCYRKSAIPQKPPIFPMRLLCDDCVNLVLLTCNSKIGYMQEYTAVYRVGVGLTSFSDSATYYAWFKHDLLRDTIVGQWLATNCKDDWTWFYGKRRLHERYYRHLTCQNLIDHYYLAATKNFILTNFFHLIQTKHTKLDGHWMFCKHYVKMILMTMGIKFVRKTQ